MSGPWAAVHVFVPAEHQERLLDVLAREGYPTIASYLDGDSIAIREANTAGVDRSREPWPGAPGR